MGIVSDPISYLDFRMNQMTFSFSDWYPAEHLFDPGRNNDSNSNDDGYGNSSTAENLSFVGFFLRARHQVGALHRCSSEPY